MRFPVVVCVCVCFLFGCVRGSLFCGRYGSFSWNAWFLGCGKYDSLFCAGFLPPLDSHETPVGSIFTLSTTSLSPFIITPVGADAHADTRYWYILRLSRLHCYLYHIARRRRVTCTMTPYFTPVSVLHCIDLQFQLSSCSTLSHHLSLHFSPVVGIVATTRLRPFSIVLLCSTYFQFC